MAFTHTTAFNWSNGANAISQSVAKTNSGEANFDETVADSVSNQLVSVGIDVSTVQSLFLLSDKDVAIYVNAASTGSPDATINLVAGIPVYWNDDMENTNPLGSTDVDSLYITNASGASATVKMRCLYDASTPA